MPMHFITPHAERVKRIVIGPLRLLVSAGQQCCNSGKHRLISPGNSALLVRRRSHRYEYEFGYPYRPAGAFAQFNGMAIIAIHSG